MTERTPDVGNRAQRQLPAATVTMRVTGQ